MFRTGTAQAARGEHFGFRVPHNLCYCCCSVCARAENVPSTAPTILSPNLTYIPTSHDAAAAIDPPPPPLPLPTASSTGISLRRATIQRAVLQLASDIRHGKCEVWELDDRRTLEYLKVTSGSVLLVCVVPTTKDILPACPPCVPPPPEVSNYPADGGSDGGGGDGSNINSDEEDEEEGGSGDGGGAGSGGFNPASENAPIPGWGVEGMAEEGEGGEAKYAFDAGGHGNSSASVYAIAGTKSGVAGSRSGAAASRAIAPAQPTAAIQIASSRKAIRQRLGNDQRATIGNGTATAQRATTAAVAADSGSGGPVRCSPGVGPGAAATPAANARRGASDSVGAASESAGAAVSEYRAGRFARRRSRTNNWRWLT